MTDTVASLESAVAELVDSVRTLENRVAVLEGAEIAQHTNELLESVPGPPQSAEKDDQLAALTPTTVLSLLGRACLVFCGAFLLRAVTDAGAIPQTAGIVFGFAYAVLWLIAADRAGRKGRGLSAEFHGVTSVMIGYPLIVEATTSFKVLGVGTAATTLAALITLGLAVAWIRRLPVLAWSTSLACVATALVLIRVTYRSEPFAVVLVLLGLATVWLAYARGWHGIRWITAFAANLVVFHISTIAAQPGPARPPFDTFSISAILTIALALFVLYLASFAVRTLIRHRNVTAFEVVQTTAVLTIGFGGAARIARTTGSGLGTLGVAAMVLGLATYAVAFVSVDRRSGRGRNFLFFTSLALILLVYGSAVAAPPAVLIPLWGAFAVASAILGGRFDRVTLRAHAAIYVGCAATASGLFGLAIRALVTAPEGAEVHLSLPALIALASAVACYAIISATQAGIDTHWRSRLPRFATALVAVLGIGAVVVIVIGWIFGGQTTTAAEMAATRSVVLAGAALALATAGARAANRELGWLVYPVLAAGGLKLLLDDLQNGSPVTLFIAFASYGIALILAPRLLKRTSAPKSA